MTGTGLRQAINEAGQEVSINQLNSLGLNRVRVLKSNHIEQLVTEVVEREIQSRESSFLDEQNTVLRESIKEKEELLNKIDENSRTAQELSQEIQNMKSSYDSLQNELKEREIQWEKEKSSLIEESKEKIKSQLKNLRQQNEETKLTDPAKAELTDQLVNYVQSFVETPQRFESDRQQIVGLIKKNLNKNSELNQELQVTQEDNDSLRKQIQEVEFKNQELKEKNAELIQVNLKTDHKITDLEESHSQLKVQFQNLQLRLRETLENISQKDQSIEELEQDNIKLNALANSSQEKLAIQIDMANKHQEVITSLEKEMTTSASKINELSQLNDSLKNQNKNLSLQAGQSKAVIAVLENTNQDFENSLDSLRQELEGKQQEVSHLKAAESQNLRDIQSLANQSRELEEKSHQLSSEKAGLELTVDTTRQENKILKKTNSGLTEQLEKISAKNKALEDELNQLEVNSTRLSKQLENVETILAEERGLFARENDDLKEKVQELESAKEIWDQKNEELNQSHFQLSESLNDLHRRHESSERECQELHAKIKRLTEKDQKSQEIIQGFLKQKETLEKNQMTLEDSLRERQQELARQVQKNADYRLESNQWMSQNQDLQNTLKNLEKQLNQEILHTEDLSSKNSSLVERIDELVADNENLSSENRSSQEELSHTQKQLDIIQSRLPAIEARAKESDSLENQVDIWKKKFAELDSQNIELTQVHKNLESRLQETLNSLESVQKGYQTWEERCRNYQHSYLQSQKELDAAKSTNAELLSRAGQLKETVDDFETVQKEHLEELQKSDEKILTLEAMIQGLEKENQKLLSSINALNLQIDALAQEEQLHKNELIESRQFILNYKEKVKDQIHQETEKLLSQLLVHPTSDS